MHIDGCQQDIIIDGSQVVDIVATGKTFQESCETDIEDCTGHAAFPTMANAHTHAAMTLLRGCGSDAPLHEWLTNWIWPKEAKLTPDMVYWGTRLACLEMIKSGTTGFANMYFYLDEEARAVADSGIRAMLGYNIPDREPMEGIQNRVAKFAEQHSSVNGSDEQMLQFAIAPHAIYTVNGELLEWSAKTANELGWHYLIHMSETLKEVDDCLHQHGCRPYEYLQRLGIPELLGERLVGAHSLHLNGNEIEIIGRNHCSVVHNPNSNLKLGSGYKFLYKELKAAGANIALGTDGCASSDNLDMLEATKLMALLQKGWRNDPTVMPAKEALSVATENGFKAMGVNAGRLEAGRKADLMLVDLDNTAMATGDDCTANLVYAAKPEAIDSVMCNGKWVMRHRTVKDEKLIITEARKAAKKLLTVLTAIIILTCTACHRNDPTEGKMIFRYNESSGIITLDPAFAKDQSLIWAATQLYNGLVTMDSNLEVQPCIAKNWTISPDGRTYTFTLRDDVFFHKNALFGNEDSTRRVTAGDFVYSFNRILDPKVASPGLWIFNNVDAANGFTAKDDSTLIIRLKQPFAPFIGLLGMPYCSVVPREVAEHYGADFRKHPCGTGPFALQLWKEGVKLVLRRNPLYFEKDESGASLPYLDAVAVTFIVDRQTAFLEFVKGNLDFMNSLAPSYKDEILTRTGQLKQKYAKDIDMVSTPYLNTEYLGFLMDDKESPLHDRRVRQAINYGFDRRKMMKYMRNNVGVPGCYGFIPCGLPGYDTTITPRYEYNPVKAKQLLAEAGYADGKGLPTLTLATTATYVDLCKFIQQQLGLLGMDIRVDVNPPGALREQIAQSKSQWFRGSWIADYPDAENYLSLFYSENFCPAGPNYTHFASAEYDKLYRKAQSETDDSTRTVMYKTMNRLIMEEAPVVVLYYDQILHFTHKNVTGLSSNAMNALDLRKVKIKN